MASSLRPYDVLLRAVHSATSELELVDIRALIAHHAGGALDEIDGVIATRRSALARPTCAEAGGQGRKESHAVRRTLVNPTS